ncbi:hypothetical protein Bpfe_006940 [Biomphalaria pfeifferi]|uniref:Sushi domain-containing protein n=1 Tax=Biomphalaria pfeifferi TaxID=112525 RepID=A0AAD8C1Q6_BIOPF|nr:hypothetical protein Bpfe_006940 [Biomphalaria pfeifferi]
MMSLLCKNISQTSQSENRCPTLYSKYGNFEAYMNENTVHFECLRNFHYVSGSPSRVCMENGRWSGENFKCEVDYYMERYKLSGCIVLSALLFSFIFFGTDLYLYANRRRNSRDTSRRRQYLSMQKVSTFIVSHDGREHPMFLKPFSRLTTGYPSANSKIKSLAEYQSTTSLPLSMQGSSYIETNPRDFWYIKSILKMSPNLDVTNNQPSFMKSLFPFHNISHHDTGSGLPTSAERVHLPTAPDQAYQGIRLIKAQRTDTHYYKDEEVIGIGRPEIKRKKSEKMEVEKPQKRKILMAMNTRVRGSDAHDLSPRWSQKEGRKRKLTSTL